MIYDFKNGRYFNSNSGTKIYYCCFPSRQENTKGKILLMHGIFANVNAFEANITYLTENGYLCLACDFPGWGKSDIDKDLYSNDARAELLWELLENIDKTTDNNPWVLLGHSMGCGAAITMACKKSNVKSLVLLNPVIKPIYHKFIVKMLKPILPIVYKAIISQYDQHKGVKQADMRRHFEMFSGMKRKGSEDGFDVTLLDGMSIPKNAISLIKNIPVLMFWAAYDERLGKTPPNELYRAENVTTLVIKGDHCINHNNAEEVNHSIVSFLNGC